MKTLFKTLGVILFGIMLASCSSTVARVSYVGLPHKYKDMPIKKQIIVRGDFIYVTSPNGTPHKIDTKIYEFEVRK